MLGEALQTALRAAGVPNGYELLKDFTRGTQVDAGRARGLHRQTTAAGAPNARGSRLLRPQQYLGLAAEMARAI